jgi:hypothetical protein
MRGLKMLTVVRKDSRGERGAQSMPVGDVQDDFSGDDQCVGSLERL